MIVQQPVYGRTASLGQSLGEYGLILGLVAVISIPAMTLLGGRLSDHFGGMLGTPTAITSTPSFNTGATLSSLPQTPAASAGPAMPPASTMPPYATSLSVTTKDGKTITLSDYPKDMKTAIATMGSNGTTEMLANTMRSMADQLLAAGEITQTQYQSLTTLANKGHIIAQAEKAMEDAAASSRTGTEFSKKTAVIDGKTYTMEQISNMSGYDNGTNNPMKLTDPLNDPSATGLVKDFVQTYKSLLGTAALNDPAVKAVVDNLSANIADLSETLSCVTDQIVYDGASPSQLQQDMLSTPSHIYSAGICTAGKGKDSGVQCSG